MIDKLIATLFLSREVAHREHLKTDKYSDHMALNEFYDSILGITDKLVENYQGRHGVIANIPILTNDKPNLSIIKVLEYHMGLLERARHTAIDKDDAVLQAIIDEVVMVYLRTIYKLKQLK